MNNIKKNVEVKGHKGTWYEIDRKEYYGQTLYLMESEQHGDEAPCIIINEDKYVVAQDIYDGFDELDERIEDIKYGHDKIIRKMIGGK